MEAEKGSRVTKSGSADETKKQWTLKQCAGNLHQISSSIWIWWEQ